MYLMKEEKGETSHLVVLSDGQKSQVEIGVAAVGFTISYEYLPTRDRKMHICSWAMGRVFLLALAASTEDERSKDAILRVLMTLGHYG